MRECTIRLVHGDISSVTSIKGEQDKSFAMVNMNLKNYKTISLSRSEVYELMDALEFIFPLRKPCRTVSDLSE